MNQTGPVRGHILAVDDQQPNLTLLTQMLEAEGHVVRTAGTGLSALEAIDRQPPDLILLDVGLPDINGFEVCRRLKHNPLTRLMPVVMVTGLNSREHRIEGINAGADDFLGKPFDSGELRARVGSLLRLKRYTDDLESAESVILSLALTVEARDPYTDGHCQRLAEYASALGRALGLSNEEVSALHRGGYLHDVGKIGIADAILQKPTPLNAAEYATMKAHTVIGDRLCGNLRSLALVRPIVRHHHELLNGAGYPDGAGRRSDSAAGADRRRRGRLRRHDDVAPLPRGALGGSRARGAAPRRRPRLAPPRSRRSVHRPAAQGRRSHSPVPAPAAPRARMLKALPSQQSVGSAARVCSLGRHTAANLLTSRVPWISHFSYVQRAQEAKTGANPPISSAKIQPLWRLLPRTPDAAGRR